MIKTTNKTNKTNNFIKTISIKFKNNIIYFKNFYLKN